MIKLCRFCQLEFETNRQDKLCCTVRCANLFRYRNPLNKPSYIKYRGANHKNFLMTLRTKLSQRRDLDIDFLCNLYEAQKGKCAISGRDLTFICGEGIIGTNISIDRIDPMFDYSEDNVRLVCRQANIMKQRLSDEELASWCKDIVEYNDKRKKK